MDSGESSSSKTLRTQAKELLESPDLTSMETLFSYIISPEDAQRLPAETLFKYCTRNYPNALSLKISHLLSCPQPDMRTQSAELLQTILSHDESNAWPRISSMIRTELKSTFLACLQRENSKPISKILCSIVSDVASEIFGTSSADWPDLIDFIVLSIYSESESLQESGLLIFVHLKNLGETLMPHLDRLHLVLLRCLGSRNWDIQVLAFGAAVSLVQQWLDSSLFDQWEDLLPAMIRAVFKLLDFGHEAFAQKCLEELVVLAKAQPRMFMPQLNYVAESMVQIAEIDWMGEKARYVAVELLSELDEAREQPGWMIRKLPHEIIGRLFSILMEMLLYIEDDPAWYDLGAEVGTGESSTHNLGTNLVDRISLALEGDITVPIVFDLLVTYLPAPEWQKRHAGITTLAVIAEGCSKEMINYLEEVAAMVSNLIQDPHPRVRWAAIDAIRLLAIDLGPELQVQYHHKVLPPLAAALEDIQNPRIQVQAALAMMYFSKNCTPNILTPYLNEILSKLLVLLQNEKQVLQEGALDAITSIACSSQEYFQKYYDAIMPCLKAILLNEFGMSKCMLCAKSVECISSVAEAVGKEKFRDDAGQIMEILRWLHASLTEADYSMKFYILKAWVRLCKCLGPDFVPHLTHVMPTLLLSAQRDIDVAIMAATSGDVINESFNQSINGVNRTGISTFLKEKALACNALSYFASHLKEGFFPWINQVVDTLVPLLKYPLDSEIRIAAVSAMPELLFSAKLAVEKGQAQGRKMSYIQKLVVCIIPSLVEALHQEPGKEICARMLNSLNRCIEVSGSLFSKAQVRLIVDEMKQVLTAMSYRKVEIAESEAEDYDMEGEEREIEEEEDTLKQVGDCLGSLIKVFKANFLPFFDELLSYIIVMWDNDKKAKERQIAFHIFYDVAYQCREPAVKYYDTYLPYLLKACNDENPDVRQEAARGIAVCAEFGGSKFKLFAGVCVSSLNAVIGFPNALCLENAKAYDIAVSALGKICEFHRESINAAEVVPTWLNYLPIKNNLIEAKVVHEQLCSMVEKLDKELLGPDNLNLPKILAVFAEVLSERDNLATMQTADRVTALLRQFKQL